MAGEPNGERWSGIRRKLVGSDYPGRRVGYIRGFPRLVAIAGGCVMVVRVLWCQCAWATTWCRELRSS